MPILWPLKVPERGNAITQRKTLQIEHLCLFIFVEPHDDSKGRWRIGGEINVPVNVKFQTHKSQAKEIKSSLTQKGIPVTGKPIDWIEAVEVLYTPGHQTIV